MRQGKLGDCYLISSMGVVGTRIKENLGLAGKTTWANPPGGYLVKFHKYQREIFVMVDDRMPVFKEDGEERLVFGSSDDN